MKSLISGILFLVSIALGGPAAAGAPDPAKQVSDVVDEVLAVLQDDNIPKGQRADKIRDIIAPYFDFEIMSRSILATNWKAATQEQKDKFIDLFGQMLQNTYIVAMENYKDQKVDIGRARIDGKKAQVETQIIDGSVKTPVVYRMRLKDNQWYAYDVVIEGVSLISNYRTSFRGIVKRDGMNALLADMEQKVNSSTVGSGKG
jgi:phospholipid transport system substrate-binding protein